jgi:hypothetical protein
MKKKHLLAAVLLLLATNAVSYWAGTYRNDLQRGKDYEAACLQADFIRYIIDEFDGETEMANIGMEIENSYEEFFQDLDNHTIWKTQHIKSMKDFEEYYWCY